MQITPKPHRSLRALLAAATLALAAMLTVVALVAGPARADSTLGGSGCLVFNPNPQLGLEDVLEDGQQHAYFDRRNPNAVRVRVYRCYDGNLRLVNYWCEGSECGPDEPAGPPQHRPIVPIRD